ncbi:hypothetical protein ACLOJK_040195 [Asimina triloba]
MLPNSSLPAYILFKTADSTNCKPTLPLMEFYGKRRLSSIIDDERKGVQSPSHVSFRPLQQHLVPETDPQLTLPRVSTSVDGERKSMQSPPHLSLGILQQHQLVPEQDPQMSPPRPSAASVLSLAPSCPGSPWTLSPIHSSSPPSLFYHCLASLHRHDGDVFSIAISRGVVFTGSASSRVRMWRLPECIERGHIKASSGDVHAILAKGNALFTAHKDRKIRVWETSVSGNLRSKKIASLPRKSSFLRLSRVRSHQHKDTISCLAYYHAEGLLYSGSHDKTVKVWRVATAKCVDSFVAHDDHINAIVVHQDDGCVFTSSSDGSIKIWRRVYGDCSHTLTMTLRFQSSPVNALALSSHYETNFLYSGSSDGFVNFWEKEKLSGRYNHGGFLQGHRFGVLCLVAVERLLLSGAEDTTIRVWRREEGSGFHTCLAVIEGHRGPVKCMAACLEMEKVVMGLLVYSASSDRTVKVWRIMLFHEEKKEMGWEEDEVMSDTKKLMESGMSPVLSPKWVEKKLIG